LENRTPIPEGMRNAQAHHMLPRAWEERFKSLRINIHDPHWGAWVEGTPPGLHQNQWFEYETLWRRWLDANPAATLQEIIDYAQQMASRYKIDWVWQP